MEDTKNINDSFDEVKIYRPKPVRVCPSSKKYTKSSLSSSTSTANSEISVAQINSQETKIDLENVSIEEINADFFLFNEYLEEEECRNELSDIINNYSDNQKQEKYSENKDFKRIKRCENPLKRDLEMLKSSYFDELIEDLNEFLCEENKEEKK